MADTHHDDIESILREGREFASPPEFSRAAHVKSIEEYEALYRRAEQDPEGFWAEQAESLSSFKHRDRVLDWNAALRPVVRRRQAQRLLQLPRPAPDRRAAQQGRHHLGGRAGRQRVLTYQELHSRSLPVRQRAQEPRHRRRAIASRSTCR